MKQQRPSLRILGTRGVPASHGGFETFAARLSPYLVRRGWNVVVYTQVEGQGDITEGEWQGVRLVKIPVRGSGPASSIRFDWAATRHAARAGEPCLTLGYNTAVFCAWLRMAGVMNVINMDGIEWQRAKWGPVARAWLYVNEIAGAALGNHLVADHPQIKAHLQRHSSADKITMIPYGADEVLHADAAHVTALGLEPGRYLTVIARAEPENSLLEIVSGFSRERRGVKLVVLGNYQRTHAYQRSVLEAASDEVVFPGAIYDPAIVSALRLHSLAYVHGHQVGGTNPSLVEALGAGNAVLAHENRFNRWVAGDEAVYFSDADAFAGALARVLPDAGHLERMRQASRERFAEMFRWDTVLGAYERLLLQWQVRPSAQLSAAASSPRNPQSDR